ncbi:transposase, partial [Yersinia frederiksenii]|uniref:transposase n=1 Tax=Yersinia frederiksenii TaxID=29484 RepID=UPI000ABFCB81
MSANNFTEEFKIEAVKQINEQGYPVSEVAARLGVSTNSLYAWIKRYQKPEPQRKQDDCSGQAKLATALEFFQNNRSDSFG